MNQIFKNPVFSIFLFCMFLLECVAIRANADSLYTGAWSKHIGAHESVKNETHNLLAYEHSGYVVGYFRNSFDLNTVIAGKRFELFEYGYFKSGIYAGVDYGYWGCNQSDITTDHRTVCLALIPEISYTKYKLQPTVMIIGNALAFSFKWDI